MVAAEPRTDETQRGAYSLLLVLSGVALGVSGLPAPLYGMYEEKWHLSPLATTLVFAVYAIAALGAVLVSGKISDVVGRKPVLLGALAAMIVGLGVFLIADNMAMLMLARIIHGAAVGSIVVAGAAALLDLRPHHGVRSGQLSGVSFNIGMTVAILGSALLAQYAPHPMRTPYAIVAVICTILGVGVVALREPHQSRTEGPIRIAKPAVPAEIRGDFWFAALGVTASWSVLGVLLSLYPSLAAQQTARPQPGVRRRRRRDHGVLGGHRPAALDAGAARRSAIVGDVGMAIALVLTVPGIGNAQLAVGARRGGSARRGVRSRLRRLAAAPIARRSVQPTRRDHVGLLPHRVHGNGGADHHGGLGGHPLAAG